MPPVEIGMTFRGRPRSGVASRNGRSPMMTETKADAYTPLELVLFEFTPRVGIESQPWALIRNPVGIRSPRDG